jgi:hypothetical protein
MAKGSDLRIGVARAHLLIVNLLPPTDLRSTGQPVARRV